MKQDLISILVKESSLMFNPGGCSSQTWRSSKPSRTQEGFPCWKTARWDPVTIPKKFKLKLHSGQVCMVHSSVIVGSLPEGSQHMGLQWRSACGKHCSLQPEACVETQQWPLDPGLYLCCHEMSFSKQSRKSASDRFGEWVSAKGSLR